MFESDAGDLVRRCTPRRDPRRWEEFLDRFANRLEAAVRRALRRRDLANRPRRDEVEDLVQEIYCRLLQRGPDPVEPHAECPGRSLGAYLKRVADTVVIDHLRSRSTLKRGRGRVAEVPDPDLPERTADPGLSPEERLLRRERRRVFLESVGRAVGPKAPRRDLLVLRLALLEGWSSREISRRMGRSLTPNGIDSLVHRVRRRLRRHGIRLPRRGQGGRG